MALPHLESLEAARRLLAQPHHAAMPVCTHHVYPYSVLCSNSSAGSSEAAAQFTAVLTNQSLIDASVTGYSGALSGTTLQSAVRGSATFNNLRLKGRPGNYTITYAVSGLLHSLPPTRLMVSARSCLVGETTNTAGDECNPCE